MENNDEDQDFSANGNDESPEFSAHGDGDVYAEVAIVSEELGDGGIEHKAVGVHDGGGNAFVDRPGGRLPGQPSSVPVQFQPVGKIFSLFSGSYELYYCKKLLMPVVLLLFFQDKHEVMVET